MFPIHLDLSFLKLGIVYHFESLYFILAIITGLVIGRKSLQKAGLSQSSEQISDFLFTSLLFALIGTRLSHFLFWSTDILIKNPLKIITPGVPGASITGGLIAGIAAGYIYCRRKKYDFYSIFSSLSPALLIAQSIGRIGCFLNGDAFGIPASKFLGVRFPRFGYAIPTFKKVMVNSAAYSYSQSTNAHGITDILSGYLYPTQLYEIAGNLLILFFVILIQRRLKNGLSDKKYIFFIHVGGYSLLRFLLEFIRADRAQVIGGFISVLQIFLLLISVFFTFMAVKLYFDRRKQSIR